MKFEKLINLRKNKGLTQKQVANKMAMEQTTYSKKERGLSPISDEEWFRLAKILEVAVEEIKEIDNSSCSKNENSTFSDNSITIQYVNIPQNAFDLILKYNAKLEKENSVLKTQLKKIKKI
ncbi:helix-turn-helix domain-containing protein [Flavobacterium dankookense]|uniref:Helix-turn-helix protein n=1 Tax=Flavobacterium dankookense TaxID=706186 RepID=A0A4R6Q722_9FLAO|nr:helix-turn-helix transcriptional regulator [Flavobacterium dankookense]TDP57413.1 helix-turn-helix protein [Flavobacterium dankookense]